MWKELPKGNQIFDFTKYTDPAYLLRNDELVDTKDVPDEILEEKPKMSFVL
jgi:hypothetical protein